MPERPDPLAFEYSGGTRLRSHPVQMQDEPLQAIMDKAVGLGGPVWKGNDRNDDPLCDVEHGLPGGQRGDRCKRQASWYVWYGCVNEHMARSGVCDEHLEPIRSTGWLCEPCWLAAKVRNNVHMIRKERISDHDPESGQGSPAGPHRQPPALPDDHDRPR